MPDRIASTIRRGPSVPVVALFPNLISAQVGIVGLHQTDTSWCGSEEVKMMPVMRRKHTRPQYSAEV